MNDSKKYPVVSKEVIDKVFTSDDGWTTVYEGPTIRMTKTKVLDNPLEYVSVDVTIPERTVVPDFPIVCGSKGCPIDPNKDYQVRVPDFHKFEGVREIMRQTEEAGGYEKEFSKSLATEDDGLVGSDSIRAGIDAEILEKMEREALAAEDAAIIDDLKRQMEAGCIMPQIYTPLQISHIFKKEDKE